MVNIFYNKQHNTRFVEDFLFAVRLLLLLIYIYKYVCVQFCLCAFVSFGVVALHKFEAKAKITEDIC